MSNMKKYEPAFIEQAPVDFEMPMQSDSSEMFNLMAVVLRKWKTAVIISIIILVVSIPGIWFVMEPKYDVTGAIRVVPILSNILTGEPDRGEISNYQSFMNTQVEMIVSTQVIQGVADELEGKQLAFFEDKSAGIGARLRRKISGSKIKPDPANILKQAVYVGVIKAIATRDNELVKVTMTSDNPEEAKNIVDAFIQSYMRAQVSNDLQGRDQKLTLLENERKVLAEKLDNQREVIQQMAQEYGSVALNERQSVMLQRVSSLLTELTKVEAQRIGCEARIQVLEEGKGIALPTEVLNKRNERINADPSIQELSRTVVRLEQEVISAKQVMTKENPLLKEKEEFIIAFKARLEEKRKELGRDFEAMSVEEVNIAVKNELITVKADLEQHQAYEKRLHEVLAKEDLQTVQIGRKQLAIDQMKEQLASTKEIYDAIGKRIQMLEMEQKQPARVSVAYDADITHIVDKRIKLTLVVMFGAVACGLLGAFVRDKADLSLHTPDDVVKRLGIRIIGTTTNPRTIDQTLLPRQMAEDYQTIRANIGLLDGGGIPRKLVITSPGTRDGKTTFTINIATSLARAGKKVLLIDGDMRKPDIGRLLNVPREARLLQDVLEGNKFEDAVYVVASVGLHVLAADSSSRKDPYELLATRQAAESIDRLSRNYDHIIIDTPPVLAFPDALLWAKMTGVVILSGFAGHTTTPDLKEAKQRLAEMGVKILGTVLSNVSLEHTYYRYGYGYYANSRRDINKNQNPSNRPLLLPVDNPDTGKKPDDQVF
jgi:succinoglycan biosynthesis transport protein ExoP